MSSVAIILKRDLPSGLVGNVCACLATGIMGLDPDINGPDFEAHGLTTKVSQRCPL